MRTMDMTIHVPMDWYLRLATNAGESEIGAKEAVMRAIQTWVFLREKQAEGCSLMVGKEGDDGWISVEVR